MTDGGNYRPYADTGGRRTTERVANAAPADRPRRVFALDTDPGLLAEAQVRHPHEPSRTTRSGTTNVQGHTQTSARKRPGTSDSCESWPFGSTTSRPAVQQYSAASRRKAQAHPQAARFSLGRGKLHKAQLNTPPRRCCARAPEGPALTREQAGLQIALDARRATRFSRLRDIGSGSTQRRKVQGPH